MREWERALQSVSPGVRLWFENEGEPLTRYLKTSGWQDPCLLSFILQLPVGFEQEVPRERARYLSSFVAWWLGTV